MVKTMKIKNQKTPTKIQNKVLEFTTPLTFKENEDDSITVTGYASTNDEDRDGDIILSSAWDSKCLEGYKRNPIILAFHRPDKPIGKAVEIETDSKGLRITARISKAAGDIYSLIKEGVLSTFSIGFMAKDMEFDQSMMLFVIKELELFEISVVSIPSNAFATFSVSKNFKSDEEFLEYKESFGLTTEENTNMVDETKNTPAAPEVVIDVAAIAKSVTDSLRKDAADRAAEKEAKDKAAKEYTISVTSAAEKIVAEATDIMAKDMSDKDAKIAEMTEALIANKEEIQKLMSTRGKMHFAADGEDGLTVEQKDYAVMLKMCSDVPFEETRFSKELLIKSGREHWDSGTLDGWEEEFQTRVHDEMRETLVIEPLFSSIPMNTPTMHMPVNTEAGFGEWIPEANFRSQLPYGQESPASGEVSSTGSAVDHSLNENILVAHKLVTKEYIGYEEEEDSIVSLMPIIREAMGRRMARSADLALLMGAGTGADPILGIVGQGANTTDVPVGSLTTPLQTWEAHMQANGGQDGENLLITARQRMGIYGLDPSKLVLLVSHDFYYELMKLPNFKTIDTIGAKATLITGQVGAILGMPVLVSQAFDNANIASDTAGTALATICRTENFLTGQLRGTMVEDFKDVPNQKRGFVISRRFGFMDLDQGEGTINLDIGA